MVTIMVTNFKLVCETGGMGRVDQSPINAVKHNLCQSFRETCGFNS